MQIEQNGYDVIIVTNDSNKKDDLRSYIRTHTGERPYKYDHC